MIRVVRLFAILPTSCRSRGSRDNKILADPGNRLSLSDTMSSQLALAGGSVHNGLTSLGSFVGTYSGWQRRFSSNGVLGTGQPLVSELQRSKSKRRFSASRLLDPNAAAAIVAVAQDEGGLDLGESTQRVPFNIFAASKRFTSRFFAGSNSALPTGVPPPSLGIKHSQSLSSAVDRKAPSDAPVAASATRHPHHIGAAPQRISFSGSLKRLASGSAHALMPQSSLPALPAVAELDSTGDSTLLAQRSPEPHPPTGPMHPPRRLLPLNTSLKSKIISAMKDPKVRIRGLLTCGVTVCRAVS